MEATAKQSLVLDYVREYTKYHGFSPTTREIQQHFKWKSQTAAINHLNALKKKGLVTWQDGKHRALVVL